MSNCFLINTEENNTDMNKGKHIITDIKLKRNSEFLTDVTKGVLFLRQWTGFNNHTILHEYSKVFPSRYDNEEGGYTCIIVLSESHMSIHTYPEFQKIAIDFYSCKNIERSKNIDFICDYFNNDIEQIEQELYISR